MYLFVFRHTKILLMVAGFIRNQQFILAIIYTWNAIAAINWGSPINDSHLDDLQCTDKYPKLFKVEKFRGFCESISNRETFPAK